MHEPPAFTIAHALGEITWLMSQSPIYANTKIKYLEQAIMPAFLLNQFRIFHDANKHPVGFAVWACLSEEVERRQQMLLMEGKAAKLEFKDWKSGDRIWLLELVSPYATVENKLLEALKAELESVVFKGEQYSYWQSLLGKH